MTAMRPLTPPLSLTARGTADLAWLQSKLGAARVRGPMLDEAGDWEVELLRADGRKTWFFARSAEVALANARAAVENPPKNRRVA